MQLSLQPSISSKPSYQKKEGPKRWVPRQVQFTKEVLQYEFAQKIHANIQALGIPIIESNNNRITGIKGATDAETYRNAKSTLAIVRAPDSMKNYSQYRRALITSFIWHRVVRPIVSIVTWQAVFRVCRL